MINRGTGIGSMPGEDFTDSLQTVLSEVGDLPYLPELPDRGAPASMTGRSLAMVSDLGVDLQPAGWRLTDTSGIDHRRARSLLAQDLDTVEEHAQSHEGWFKLQVAGPWTLAATVERPRGDKVLADHGARRDLAQALAEGVRQHIAEVQGRLGRPTVIVQLDEPALPAVLAGSVATASGFSRHRAVTSADAARSLGWVLDAVHESGAESVVHCCAAHVPLDVLMETQAQAVSVDLGQVSATQYDDIGRWLDAGRQVWLGVVPSTDPPVPPPSAATLTQRVLSWWSRLGYSDVEKLPATTVTPVCGLAGASPAWARQALARSREVARNLSVEQGKMEP
ncbi:MAG: methionine synthase [Nocardioidaceae bacterium]